MMLNNMSARDLINSKQFIPVDELITKLIQNNNKQIILTGGRGVGKTVSLYYLQEKTLYTDNLTIYTWFDSISTLGKEPNELYNEKFFNHYYELIMCFKLISYINDYYKVIYNTEFKDLEKTLNEIASDTDLFISNRFFENRELKKYLQTGEISNQIIEKLKSVLALQELNLAIDRFDWTNKNSIYVQKLLNNYFPMFNKTIITADDENINKDQSIIVECNYGNNINYLRQIVNKRIPVYNETLDYYFDGKMITDQMYRKLIEKCQGNISLMFDVINEALGLCSWDRQFWKLEEYIDYAIQNQLDIHEKVKKMSTPHKLYL